MSKDAKSATGKAKTGKKTKKAGDGGSGSGSGAGGSGGVGGADGEVNDDLDLVPLDGLEAEYKKLSSKLSEVRRSRNYFALERDQYQGYYDTVHADCVKTQQLIRLVEAEMEHGGELHREQIRGHLQHVTQMEYKHADSVDREQQSANFDLNAESEDFKKKKQQLTTQKLQLKAEVASDEKAYEDELKDMKEDERKQMAALRERLEKEFQALSSTYAERLNALKADLQLRRKMEMHEIEERKNKHIKELMDNHERAFEKMRTYFNQVTRDNLDMIRFLQSEIKELNEKAEKDNQTVREMREKNKKLSEPKLEAEREVARLNSKLTNFQKDRASLQHARARLSVLTENSKKLSEQHEALKQQFAQMEKERDTLYRTFEKTVLSVAAQSDAKNHALEQLLYDATEQFERKKAQFTEIVRSARLDPVVLQSVTRKLDDVLTAKNEQIAELRYEIQKLAKAHNDLVRVYESKLEELGIPHADLNLRPLVAAHLGVPQHHLAALAAAQAASGPAPAASSATAAGSAAAPAAANAVAARNAAVTASMAIAQATIHTAPADLIV